QIAEIWQHQRSRSRPNGQPPESSQLDDRFHETCGLEPATGLWIPGWGCPTRSCPMSGWRQVFELAMSGEEIESLLRISRSRTEPAHRVERAQILLAYRENRSFFRVGQGWCASSNRRTLCRARGGLWAVGGTRRSAPTRQGADDYPRGQSLVG